MLEVQQDLDTGGIKDIFYRGIVVDNNDPENMSRVKVRVQEIFGTSSQVPDADLPWAVIMQPFNHGGKDDISNQIIPEVDSEVIVVFHQKEFTTPIVIGRLVTNASKLTADGSFINNHDSTGWDNDSNPGGANRSDFHNYPNRYGSQDRNQNHFFVDLVDQFLQAFHTGNISLTNDGDLNILIQGNLKIKVEGNIEIECTGNHDEKIGGEQSQTIGGQANQTAVGDILRQGSNIEDNGPTPTSANSVNLIKPTLKS